MANTYVFTPKETQVIIDLYLIEKKTILEIAKLNNCSHGKIKLLLEKNNVEFRSHSENHKIVMNRPEVLENVSKASKKSSPKRIKTNMIKYQSEVASNNPEIKKEWKSKHLNEHGVEWPNQRKDIRDDYKNTCLEKYGVNNVSKTKEVQLKIKKNRWEDKSEEELNEIYNKCVSTWLKNMGVDNPLKSEEVVEKIRKTCLENRGVDWITKDREVIEKIIESHRQRSIRKMLDKFPSLNLELIGNFTNITTKVNVKCLKCNTVFETVLDYVYHSYGLCPKCFPINSSIPESDLKDFIKTLFDEKDLLFNDRKILNGKELDIIISPLNIAIELDGLYYHSEKIGINWDYHINKTEECLKKGIRLIHIFEDEWILKKEIVKSRLKQILGRSDSLIVHARKCIIKEVQFKDKEEFLNSFHIQGSSVSMINLGAYYENKLVAIMTFSHGSIAKGSSSIENIWELDRFCSNPSFHINGIASKLLTYFKNNYSWNEIFSYADRRWSNGNLYYKLGFNLLSSTKPNYWYVKNYQRIHRFNLRKKESDNKDVPEWILRQNEGYTRIWDCGSLKFIIKNI